MTPLDRSFSSNSAVRSGSRRSMCLVWACLLVAGLVVVTLLERGVPASRDPKTVADRLPRVAAGSGDLSLVFLGTSLSSRGQWASLVAQQTQSCSERAVHASAIAVPGANSRLAGAAIHDIISAAPDILFVEFAINDAAMHRGMSLAASERNIRQLVRKMARASPDTTVVLMTTNPATGPEGVVRPGLGSYYQQYRDLAAETGVGLLDMHARWLGGEYGELSDALPDGLHPSAEVRRSTSRTVAEAICSML